MAIFPIACN